MGHVREWIEIGAQSVEALAVALMVFIIFFGSIAWVFRAARKSEGAYERYRVILGKTLLVGLELLVAADIIRTVALQATLINIVTLGGLVMVRTFLGWTLTLEVEGRWPWQKGKEPGPGPAR
jgi:uncharacterized membrane protein